MSHPLEQFETWFMNLYSNIDAHFQAHRFLMFPSKSIHTDGIRAGVMVRELVIFVFSVLNAQSRQSSFGFGQVGGTALVIHPRYLLGSLEPSVYESYKVSNRARGLQSYKAMSEMMITNSLVKIKEAPPYSLDMERRVLLNSMARASLDPKTGSYSFSKKLSTIIQTDATHIKAAKEISRVLSETGSATGVGIDHGRSFIA